MNYSKFGSTSNALLIGPQGPQGVGFDLTINGDYDISNKSMVNIDNLSADTITLLNPPNDEGATQLLAISGNDIVYRTTFPAPYDQDLNQADNVVFNKLHLGSSPNFTPDVQCYIRSTDDVGLWLDSDSNNGPSESDNPFLIMTSDGVNSGAILSMNSNNVLRLTTGTSIGDTLGVFEFSTGLLSGSSSTRPSFSSESTIMRINASGVGLDRLLNNDVPMITLNQPASTTQINSSRLLTNWQELASSVPAQPTTGTAGRFYNNNGSPRWANSTEVISLDDPYLNQLKTTQSPTFDGVTTNSISNAGTSMITLNGNNSPFDNYVQVDAPRLILGRYVDFAGTTDTGVSGLSVTGGRLYSNNAVPSWRTTTGVTSLIDPYSNQLKTSETPSFSGLSLTGVALDNAETTMLMLNGSNQIVRRTTGINVFDQTLNTTSQPSFAAIGLTGLNPFISNRYLVLSGTSVGYRDLDFGASYFAAESLGLSTTANTTTFQNKVSLAANITQAGTYMCNVSFLIGGSGNGSQQDYQITLNNIVQHLVPTVTSSGLANAVTPQCCQLLFTLPTGLATINLDYKALNNTARISDGRIIMFRVS